MRSLVAAFLLVLCQGAHGQEPLATPHLSTSYIEEIERFQQRVFDAAAPSVVVIRHGDTIGTGFFVTASGLILTNRHVVGSARTVNVETFERTKLIGNVIELAEGELDLALIQVGPGSYQPLKMAPLAKLRVGSWVATIGHGYGGVWTFTTGMISNIYPVGDDKPIVQTQIPVNPGNSGGPILDKEGNAIAVVTAKLNDADNVNFSIRLDVAFKSLQKLAASCDCLVIRTHADVPVFVNGLLVGKGPRVLLPLEPGVHEVMIPASGGLKRSVTFPAARMVDLFASDSLPELEKELGASKAARSVWVLDLARSSDLANAPRVIAEWIGLPVILELKDGTRVRGTIAGFRPPATLKLSTDGEDQFVSLWQLQKIERL